ncbi:NUDIX domain-containing protein [Francisella tularensis]|uniref:MutT/nudix family protein n=2 Tax=Francisella tularensis subsp. holarctica TaxID=119857 RepID=A0AAI8FTH9_FRATH|nr:MULTISPECIES: NUDIX domain-containing protein [Francisella]AHH45779.1 DNA mismatch repair protein MutT [Francisella tularensis subsp. holarctica PHIT-FT049]ABI82239.1 probable MutT/nudix hydrolase [Francisella tularensis subsp. holarctica OSU18]AFT92206.1 MutT/nudix family protein [Francisella tularensis subsp. holarctica FSC200]AJI50564.1 NUDIX domain protein [Francisella tularensis subsp. holarctica]AJI58922.1 NUDIX domain protein [Francisella tularensis subsp. holarctica LVS]
MIKTSALVCVRDNKILLVRVRDNTVWYFPGGKIDAGESPLQAIIRELNEELNIQMQQTELDYLGEVVTDNHDRTDIVSVHCYAGEITQRIIPAAEISAIKWFDLDDTKFMAPAVIESIARWFKNP